MPDRKVTDVSNHGQDREVGENLWKLTEQILSKSLGSLPYPIKST